METGNQEQETEMEPPGEDAKDSGREDACEVQSEGKEKNEKEDERNDEEPAENGDVDPAFLRISEPALVACYHDGFLRFWSMSVRYRQFVFHKTCSFFLPFLALPSLTSPCLALPSFVNNNNL